MESVPVLCLALLAMLPAVLTYTEPALPAPSNVSVYSYNLQHILRWDPVEVKNESGPVMYNVRFEMASGSRELCINITETECNFTEKILPLFRGKPMVQAELGSRRSDWVILPEFQPSKNTIIGPVKSLELRSHSGHLMVDFKPPFSPNSDVLTMQYILSYWKENSEKEFITLKSATNYLLDRLEPNVIYCVQVYAYTTSKAYTISIKGQMSDTICEATSRDITLFVVLGCVFGFVLLFCIIGVLVIPERPLQKALYGFKKWLDGPYRIPSDVLEYLEDPTHMTIVECAQNVMEDPCDHISIVGLDPSQDVNEGSCLDHCQSGSEKT